MENLRICLVQAPLVWEDKSKNLDYFSRQLAGANPAADLILLPEMFTTGFSMAAERLAEDMEGPSVQWMQKIAADTAATVCGSLIIAENGRYYNRLIWMMPDGSCRYYNKRHLFTLVGEDRWYTAGQDRLLVSLKGWRILPLICYDLRFPVWSRNVDHYDLLIYVANWPERRRSAWQTLLQARAIENQAYTIGVNRIGTDENQVRYAGDSAVIDYRGEVRFQAAYQEVVPTLSLNYQEQQRFREKYAFLADRDQFSIKP